MLISLKDFFRKLKFQYQEQKTKDQFIKIILSDDPPDITPQDVQELKAINAQKKKVLKQEKSSLAETYKDIQMLAPLVEEGTLL